MDQSIPKSSSYRYTTEAIYINKSSTSRSLNENGRVFTNRDLITLIHSVKIFYLYIRRNNRSEVFMILKPFIIFKCFYITFLSNPSMEASHTNLTEPILGSMITC